MYVHVYSTYVTQPKPSKERKKEREARYIHSFIRLFICPFILDRESITGDMGQLLYSREGNTCVVDSTWPDARPDQPTYLVKTGVRSDQTLLFILSKQVTLSYLLSPFKWSPGSPELPRSCRETEMKRIPCHPRGNLSRPDVRGREKTYSTSLVSV